MYLYMLHQNMDKALNQQLLGVVKYVYVRSLKKKDIGYRIHTYLEVIYYLKVKKGKITATELNLNTARINMPYNINELFESIIDQIDTSIDFAYNRNVPYIPERFMNTAYNLIFVTGHFTNACRRWNHNPEVDKTWVAF